MTVQEAKERLTDLIKHSPYLNTEETNFEICELCMYIYKETENVEYLEAAYSTGLMTNMEYKLNEYLKAIDRGQEIYTYEVGNLYSSGVLGYKDHKKAFEYYTRAAKTEPFGDGKSLETAFKEVATDAKLKLAVMYKEGIYVERSYEKYKELISELSEQTSGSEWYEQNYEILKERANILINDGKIDEGLELLFNARNDVFLFVSKYGLYIDELIGINRMIYTYLPFDYSEIEPEDITFLLEKEHKIIFRYEDEIFLINVEKIDDRILIYFENQYYSDPVTFLETAVIGEKEFCLCLTDTYGWEVNK